MKKINLAYERLRDVTTEPNRSQTSASRPTPSSQRREQAASADSSNAKSSDQSQGQQPPPRQQQRPPPKAKSSSQTPPQSSRKQPVSSPKLNWGWRIVIAGIVCAPFVFLAASLDWGNNRHQMPANEIAAQVQASELQLSPSPAVLTATSPLVINTNILRYTSSNSAHLKEMAKDLSRRYAELQANAEECTRKAAQIDDMIFAELQQRFTDAQAKLVELQSEAQGPTAEYRAAKIAKEKILSEIVEHIASTERRLDVAEGDSASLRVIRRNYVMERGYFNCSAPSKETNFFQAMARAPDRRMRRKF